MLGYFDGLGGDATKVVPECRVVRRDAHEPVPLRRRPTQCVHDREKLARRAMMAIKGVGHIRYDSLGKHGGAICAYMGIYKDGDIATDEIICYLGRKLMILPDFDMAACPEAMR